MNSPISALLEGGALNELVIAISDAQDTRLEAEARQLTDEAFDELTNRVYLGLHATHLTGLLVCGAVLHLYRVAADAKGRGERFGELIEQLGVSQTKAYDAIAVFRCFGKSLRSSEKLRSRFPVEALKRLAAKSTPPAAREAALQYAAGGERITIKRAEALIAEFGPTAPLKDVPIDPHAETQQGPAARPSRSAPRRAHRLWSYCGRAVRIVVEADGPRSLQNAVVMHDVYEALEKLRAALDGQPLTPQLEAV